MVRAFLLSLAQLGDRAILRVLVRSLAATLAIFAAAGTALYLGLGALLGSRLDGLAAAVAVATGLLAAWLLFRAVAVGVVGLWGDDIVRAVERRHYPAAAAGARDLPFPRAAAMGLGSAARAVLVNLLALPVYLALLVTGIGAPLLFLAVNAWLLGRDLGDTVAARHMAAAALPAWRARTRGGRALLGLAAATLFVIPGLNLLAPVLGAAMATHWFHRSKA